MNVGVTVRAPTTDIAEYQLGMALDAIHLDVHAAQRVGGLLVVIELRNCPDRFPTCLCMAILAGDGEGTVRAARVGISHTTILPLRRNLKQEREQHSQQQHYPRSHERSVLRTWNRRESYAGKPKTNLIAATTSYNCPGGQYEYRGLELAITIWILPID